jgi:hypothetical protein
VLAGQKRKESQPLAEGSAEKKPRIPRSALKKHMLDNWPKFVELGFVKEENRYETYRHVVISKHAQIFSSAFSHM